MLEPHQLHPDDRTAPTPSNRRGERPDRRHSSWHPGQPERRHACAERRRGAASLELSGRRRGLPDRRASAPSAQVPLPVGQDLLPVVSHELRTPLTSIQGYAELLSRRLRQRGAPDDLLGPVSAINVQARRLGALLNELLDLTELAQPNARLQAGRIELAELLAEARAAAQAQTRRHTIVVQATPPLPVRGDALRLRQLADELLRNAVKYAPDGGEIQARAWTIDDHVRFVVADRGIGIAPEHLARIFEPFYQVQPASTSFGGLGLGLTLCRAIVERHDGRLWVESTLGQGSAFYVELPRARPRRA